MCSCHADVLLTCTMTVSTAGKHKSLIDPRETCLGFSAGTFTDVQIRI